MKPILVTNAIPYVNAKPHIGHALEFVQSDAIARYSRLLKKKVYYLCGTDDNALKNVQAAEVAGIPAAQFVAENANHFKKLLAAIDVSNDDFIQTASDPRHLPGAQKLWNACKKEDIEKRVYTGFYCVGCEEFKTEKDLVNGECPEHPGKILEKVSEENYFFRLDHYADELRKLIETDKIQIFPGTRKNEVLRFIEGGLEPFSISRSNERARGWGVPVPGDASQVMYVWFDALANYITALNYATNGDSFNTFWVNGEVTHVIGKGIIRFHAIYWPAMLLSAGLPLPKNIFVHGYVTVDGQKMSKSIGNVVDPIFLTEEFGSEAVRYYFLREVSTFEDGDFSYEKFKTAYNAGLANGLGNLVSRLLKLSGTYLTDAPEIPENAIPENWKNAFERFEIQEAAAIVWEAISALDRRIQETEVFRLVKTDPEKGRALLREMLVDLYTIGRMLHPILPQTSERIIELIKANRMPEAPLFPRKD